MNRDKFANELRRLGVNSGVYYPTPVHKLASFGTNAELKNTDLLASECLSLPIHPDLSETDLEHIVKSVNSLTRAGV